MDSFDPAINYGPNDAGISAVSIVLVTSGVIIGSWLIGIAYSRVTDFFHNLRNNDKQ